MQQNHCKMPSSLLGAKTASDKSGSAFKEKRVTGLGPGAAPPARRLLGGRHRAERRGLGRGREPLEPVRGPAAGRALDARRRLLARVPRGHGRRPASDPAATAWAVHPKPRSPRGFETVLKAGKNSV